MNKPTVKSGVFRSVIGTLFVFGLMGATLFAAGRKDYPDLHTILDTGMFLLTAILTLLLWDMGGRINNPLPKYLAVSFAVTALLNFIHVMVTVEWSGPFVSIAHAAGVLRPGTWPPAVHELPIGVACSVWLVRRNKQCTWQLASALLVLSAGMLVLFNWLPLYTPPGWLGITRPTLILAPLLWLAAGWQCWRLRATDRMLPMLVPMSGALLLGNIFMLYSSAPHDMPAMEAHLIHISGHLILLVSLMQMAGRDMQERFQAERELAQLNQGLEQRVLERTAELERTTDGLRASEERTRLIIETALDAVVTIDSASLITGWSPQAETIFGWARQEVLGRPLAETIIPKHHRAAHQHGLQRYLKTGEAVVLNKRIELTALHRDGREFPIELSITPIRTDGTVIFSAFVRDITERKQAEVTRTKFAAIIESSDDAIISKTLDGIITSWNPGAEKLFGYSAKEAIGNSMLMLFPPERVGEEAEILAKIRRGEGVDHFETVRVTKEGKRINVSVTLSPIRDDQGKITGASKIARDITDRKLAEVKLQAQLGRLNLLHQITRATGERQDLQSIFQVVIRCLEDDLPIDFSCICIYDQPAYALKVVAVGIKSEPTAMELAMTEQAVIPIDENGLSRCVRGQLVYEPDISGAQFPFPQRLARGGLRSLVVAPLLVESKVFGVLVAARRQPRSFVSGECEFLKQLSEHVALASHQSQLYSALQQAYDDLRQTQQAVMQQERLRALGQMASGIAHDINNAISPVTLYTESLLENEPNLSERGRGYLQTIAHAIDDVAATVARMREFYRQREPQLLLASVNLNQLVQQVVDLSRARWNDMPQQRGIVIKMETDLRPDLPAIMGVESEIREALINLIFNGVDALPEGGTLTLRTKVVETTPGPPAPPTPRQVQVEVADTGVGMDEETRRRCLEPFFTTKGERGTGLGLAMVYGMVKRHSADIEIETANGKGTTVRLSFAVPTTSIVDAAHPARAYAGPSRLRILVVDDDPLLIKSLRDTLETDGHLVVACNGGEAGIVAFHEAIKRKEPFAVVITDLGMPYVDGRKVASAVKLSSPTTPVIMLTGWGQRLVAEGDVPSHVDRVLNKPPKLHDLRTALAEVTA